MDRPRCYRHEPDISKLTRDKDGTQADLLNIRDYPVRSVCLMCRADIITYGVIGRAADWYEPDERPQKKRLRGKCRHVPA